MLHAVCMCVCVCVCVCVCSKWDVCVACCVYVCALMHPLSHPFSHTTHTLPTCQKGNRQRLDEIHYQYMHHHIIRGNSTVRVLPAGVQPPAGAHVKDCMTLAHHVRSRYELAQRLPLNSNVRRVALQSLHSMCAGSREDDIPSILRVYSDKPVENMRQARLGLKAAAARTQKVLELFRKAGNSALPDSVVRTLELTGAGAHTGHSRTAPSLNEQVCNLTITSHTSPLTSHPDSPSRRRN